MNGGSPDWESTANVPPVLSAFPFIINPLYGATNWTGTSPFLPPYGQNLTLPVGFSELLPGEVFPAGSILFAGATFDDLGTVVALGEVTIAVSSDILVAAGGNLQSLPGVTLQTNATLTVQGTLETTAGGFNGADAVSASFAIDPGALVQVGVGVGAGMTLTSPLDLHFVDDGDLQVGGNLVLEANHGVIDFATATVTMDSFPVASGRSVIDNASGTVSANLTRFTIGSGAGDAGAVLQLGVTGDRSVLALDVSTISGFGSIDNQTTVLAEGAATIAPRGSYLNDGATALTEVLGGVLSFRSGGTTTAIAAASAGTFEIGAGGTLDLGANTSVGGATVDFAAPSGTLAVTAGIAQFSSAVRGFALGDALEIEGATVTGAEYNGVNTLRVFESNGGAIDFTNITIPGHGEGFLTTRNAGANGFVLLCFAEGTRLRTPDGECAVEALRAGATVMTPEGPRRVRWIGRRSVDLRAHPCPALAAPVRVAADAIAPGVPARALRLSPDHAVLVDGRLIPVRMLVNGGSIAPCTAEAQVTYFHVELDQHALLYAHGLPAESFRAGGMRAFFASVDGTPADGAAPAMPLTNDAAAVHTVWERLAARSQQLGHAPWRPAPARRGAETAALWVRGRKIRPLELGAGRIGFALPRGGGRVRLESATAAPAARQPWRDDRRELGLCVRRIVVTPPEGPRDVPLDHPSLAEGWWAEEQAPSGARHRWTDGRAYLNVPRDAAMITFEIA